MTRLELLHKEFMMLTPFRTSRTAKMLDVTCKYCSYGSIAITTFALCLTVRLLELLQARPGLVLGADVHCLSLTSASPSTAS